MAKLKGFSLRGRHQKTKVILPEKDEWYDAEDDDLEDEDVKENTTSGMVKCLGTLILLSGCYLLSSHGTSDNAVSIIAIIGIIFIWH